MKFLSRTAATFFLGELGVAVGETGLANLASKGRGPKYGLINGRAYYTRENLLEWVEAAVQKRAA